MQRKGIIDGAVRSIRDDEQSCSKIVQSDSTVMGVRSSYESSQRYDVRSGKGSDCCSVDNSGGLMSGDCTCSV